MARAKTSGKQSQKGKSSGPATVGRSDRYPSDYGVRDKEETNASWLPGDKGQGREGLSKGYGGSGGTGTGPSGPSRKQRRDG
jgi:hypothetical protein